MTKADESLTDEDDEEEVFPVFCIKLSLSLFIFSGNYGVFTLLISKRVSFNF